MLDTTKFYISYPPDTPPEHPGPAWTRFVCISDTHYLVPPGDILLHGGDLSSWGTFKHLRKTVDWLRTLPHELKIIIAGNHDLSLDPNWKAEAEDYGFDPKEVDASQEMMRSDVVRDAGIIYLDRQHTVVTTSGGKSWTVYGSPAAPFHVQGAFQYTSEEEAKVEWSQISPDVEILLTHTPPLGILDTTRRGKNAGCAYLSTRLTELHACRLHVFGHIHEAHGASLKRRTVVGADGNGIELDLVSVNAALRDIDQPIIVDLKR
ncbi:hypothetical protein EW145_g1435 [Phellinidium pouzarii]|uniref:Calcineurin-like phosphoesterase domain-containing protein n=1 Tax=Phellinidium pouzarii TaxID=167371 RepID=A0A4S4LEG1_9AGAM|nr:hypothetical protein EW145_g1435 [Phellinidium pouzarii]